MQKLLMAPKSTERDWRHIGTLIDGTMIYAVPKCAFSECNHVYRFVPSLSSYRYMLNAIASLKCRTYRLADSNSFSSLHDMQPFPIKYGCPDCGAKNDTEAERNCTGLDTCPMADGNFSECLEQEIEHLIAILDGKTMV